MSLSKVPLLCSISESFCVYLMNQNKNDLKFVSEMVGIPNKWLRRRSCYSARDVSARLPLSRETKTKISFSIVNYWKIYFVIHDTTKIASGKAFFNKYFYCPLSCQIFQLKKCKMLKHFKVTSRHATSKYFQWHYHYISKVKSKS